MEYSFIVFICPSSFSDGLYIGYGFIWSCRFRDCAREKSGYAAHCYDFSWNRSYDDSRFSYY